MKPQVVLYFGVIMVTTSSFIIRYAGEEPYMLAASRVLLTAMLSFIISRFMNYPSIKLTRRQVLLILLSGISLASHFGWWFASLDYLVISISLSLTNTAPVWLLIISIVFYKQRPHRWEIASVFLVIIGSALLFSDTESTTLEITGLLLALGSAIGFAVYLIIAKQLVDEIGLYRYFAMVNLVAGITLITTVSYRGGIRYSNSLLFFGLLLAMIPGILGHANYNYGMARLPQLQVALATLGEPILGTIFAFIIFREVFSLIEGVALICLLIAILLSLITDNQ